MQLEGLHTAEGSSSNTNSNEINLNAWLQEHRLNGDDTLKSIFKEKHISVEELLELNDNDLKQQMNDWRLDIITKKRLQKAVKITNSRYNDKSTVQIIVSHEENDAILQLSKRYEFVSNLINNIQSALIELSKQCDICPQEINQIIDTIIDEIKNHKQLLLKQIDEITENKKKALHEQLCVVEKYQSQVKNSRIECEQIIYSNKGENQFAVNRMDRLQLIEAESNKIFNNSQIAMHILTKPKLKFNFIEDNLSMLLDQLKLDLCDEQCAIQNIKIHKIGFYFIELLLPFSLNTINDNIYQYEIKYAIYRKPKIENKNKHQNKQNVVNNRYINPYQQWQQGININTSQLQQQQQIQYALQQQMQQFQQINFQNPARPYPLIPFQQQQQFQYQPQNNNIYNNYNNNNNNNNEIDEYLSNAVDDNVLDIDDHDDDEKKSDDEYEWNSYFISNEKKMNTDNTDNKILCLSNLQPQHGYIIRVRYKTKKGWSKFSELIRFETLKKPKEKPIKLKIAKYRGYFQTNQAPNLQQQQMLLSLQMQQAQIPQIPQISQNKLPINHPKHLLDPIHPNTNTLWNNSMYRSESYTSFKTNECDWIIFKSSNKKSYQITRIEIQHNGTMYAPYKLKLEIGDKILTKSHKKEKYKPYEEEETDDDVDDKKNINNNHYNDEHNGDNKEDDEYETFIVNLSERHHQKKVKKTKKKKASSKQWILVKPKIIKTGQYSNSLQSFDINMKEIPHPQYDKRSNYFKLSLIENFSGNINKNRLSGMGGLYPNISQPKFCLNQVKMYGVPLQQ